VRRCHGAHRTAVTVIALSAMSGSVHAGDATPCPGADCYQEVRGWLHAVSARSDVGSASAYGLGYAVGRMGSGSGYPDAFYYQNLSLALDARAVTRNHSQVDATILSLAARAGASGSMGGFALELLGGVGEPRQGSARALMSAGVFWSLYVLEVGYSYQFPLGGSRPDWMSAHQFSVRINIPIYLQGRVTTDYPRPGKKLLGVDPDQARSSP